MNEAKNVIRENTIRLARRFALGDHAVKDDTPEQAETKQISNPNSAVSHGDHR